MNETMMEKCLRMINVMIKMVEEDSDRKKEYGGIILVLYFAKVCFSGEFFLVQGVITILSLMRAWKKIGESYMEGMDEIV